ncbi:MAG: transporter [Pseudomonadota bacterium]
MRRSPPSLRRRAALAVACAIVGGPPAAADWSARLSLSQRIEGDSNIRLEETSDSAVRSVTTATLRTVFDSPTTKWTTSLGVSGVGTIGEEPGTSEDRINPNLRTSVAYQAKRLGLTGDLRLRRRQVSRAQFEEAGFTEDDGAQIDVNGDVGVSYQIDPRSSLRFGASADATRFEDNSEDLFTESETFGLSAGYSYRVSDRTRLSLGGGLRFFFADNEADTETTVFTISAGVAHEVNSRLSVAANAGVDFDSQERTEGGVRSTESDIGFTGDASVSWRPDGQSSLTFSVGQALNPSAFGALQRTTSLSLGYASQLTQHVGFDFGLTAADRSGGGSGEGETSRQTLSFSPALSYQVTRDWRASLGYEFRLSDDEDTRTSNAVFLQVGRTFTLIP